MKSCFNELMSKYTYIYTDSSKDYMRVGCAVVSDNYSENLQIPDGSSLLPKQKLLI